MGFEGIREDTVLTLFVWMVVHLYCLPEGRRLNKCWPEWGGSFIIFFALLRQRLLEMSSREDIGQPMARWMVLITLCTAFLSAAEQLVYYTMMQYISTLSMAKQKKATNSFSSV